MDIISIFDKTAEKLNIKGIKFPEIMIQDGPSQVIDNIIYINKEHTKNERFHEKVLAHEMVHYLIFSEHGQLIGSLDEGIAVYIADNEFYKEVHGFTVHDFSKVLVEKKLLYPIKEIIDNRNYYGKRHDIRIDIETASFVGFLIEKHGLEKFFSMYKKVIHPTKENPVCNIFKVFKDVYKKDIHEFQNDWEYFLKIKIIQNDVSKKLINSRKFDKEIPIKSIHCHGCAYPISEDKNQCQNCNLPRDITVSF